MTPEAVEIAMADGPIVRGQYWKGESQCVALLHASGESMDLDGWRPLIPFLLENDVSTLAADIRGHGLSDGEFNKAAIPEDIGAIVNWLRSEGATSVVVCAAGDSGISALLAAEKTKVDGLILLSPDRTSGAPPRGPGVPKLLIGGVKDSAMKDSLSGLREASIGPALAVNIPTDEQGVELLAGEWSATCREHIFAFLRERKWEQGARMPAGHALEVERKNANDQGDGNRLPSRGFHSGAVH